MSETPDIDPTEENLRMVEFMKELLVVFKRHGLTQKEREPEIPHERAANVMLTEIHDWYRSGRIETDAESFRELCVAAQEANYEVDDMEEEFSGTED